MISMAKVYIHPQLQNVITKLSPLVEGLVLFETSYRQIQAPMIGNYGRFEENPRAMLAGIHKLHIAVSDDDFLKWRGKIGQQRKSDNYLVYAKHDLEIDTYLIIDFISPEAHKRIRSRLADLVMIAEEFQETFSDRFPQTYLTLN